MPTELEKSLANCKKRRNLVPHIYTEEETAKLKAIMSALEVVLRLDTDPIRESIAILDEAEGTQFSFDVIGNKDVRIFVDKTGPGFISRNAALHIEPCRIYRAFMCEEIADAFLKGGVLQANLTTEKITAAVDAIEAKILKMIRKLYPQKKAEAAGA